MDDKLEKLKDNIKIFLKSYLNNTSSLLEKSIMYSLDLLDTTDFTNIYTIYTLSHDNIENYMSLVLAYTLNLISIYIYYDLPSMLDKPNRNNIPNIHVFYGEAVSHLCTVSLCSLEFEILSNSFKNNSKIFSLFDKYSNNLMMHYDKSNLYNSITKSFDNNHKNNKILIKEEMEKRILTVSKSMIETIYILSNNEKHYQENIEDFNNLLV